MASTQFLSIKMFRTIYQAHSKLCRCISIKHDQFFPEQFKKNGSGCLSLKNDKKFYLKFAANCQEQSVRMFPSSAAPPFLHSDSAAALQKSPRFDSEAEFARALRENELQRRDFHRTEV